MEQKTTWAASAGAPIDAPTVCGAFQRLVAQQPTRLALRTRDGSVALNWAQLGDRVRQLAAGLAGLGVEPGDTVAMLLPNVPECHMIDLAAIHLGAIPFTIYNTSPAEQIQHKLEIADSRIIFTQHSFLPRVLEAKGDLPALEQVIVIDADAGLDEVYSAADERYLQTVKAQPVQDRPDGSACIALAECPLGVVSLVDWQCFDKALDGDL